MKLPYYHHWFSDWESVSRRMTCTEYGAFIRLTEAMWHQGERTGTPSLKDNNKVIARILGLTEKAWIALRENLVGDETLPFVTDGDNLTCEFISDIFDKAVSKHARQSEGGRKSRVAPTAEPRRVTCKLPETNLQVAVACYEPTNPQTDVPTDLHTNRPTYQQTNVPTKGSQLVTDFDRLWEAYPKKTSRDAALRAYYELRKDKKLPPIEELLASVVEHIKRDPVWTNPQYICSLSNYLINGRWKDEFVSPSNSYDPLKQALSEGR